jgi:hypothetical protein
VTGYGLDDRSSIPGRGWEFLSSVPCPDRFWGPPIQWVPGVPTLGVKRPDREADHSLPSNAEVKERVELYFHSLSTSLWRGA